MKTTLDLSIIIVNWHSAEFVRRCVASIRKCAAGLRYEIIVVDNASFDGCDRALETIGAGVKYLQSGQNIGFARANNLGFNVSSGRNLLFLNPDTEIPGDALQRLSQALDGLPGAGAAGGRLLNADGSLQTSCIQSFPTILNQALNAEILRRLWPKSALWGMATLYETGISSSEVAAISGACLMIKRAAFEQVGLFSENYFMYTEDIDLCYKVKKAGWKNYFIPEAAVVHFGGSSSKQAASNFASVMLRESVWRFFCKTRGRRYAAAYRILMCLSAMCRLAALSVAAPFVMASKRVRRRWSLSFSEWRAVFRWGIRLEKWSSKAGERKAAGECGLLAHGCASEN